LAVALELLPTAVAPTPLASASLPQATEFVPLALPVPQLCAAAGSAAASAITMAAALAAPRAHSRTRRPANLLSIIDNPLFSSDRPDLSIIIMVEPQEQQQLPVSDGGDDGCFASRKNTHRGR
jgi:hypothetical protein